MTVNEDLNTREEHRVFSERPSARAGREDLVLRALPGNEFVYPRTQAIAIASVHAAVLASKDDSTDESAMKTAEVTRIDENGNEVADNASAANMEARNETAPAPVAAPAASVAPAVRRPLRRTS